MLDTAVATRFIKKMSAGKTRPALLACDVVPDREVELVTKFSAGCEQGVLALAAEAIAAMLAADLDLPCPEPFLVRVDPDFVEVIPDREVAAQARKSSPVAFGSIALPPGFGVWPIGRPLPKAMIQAGAEIIAFDAMIQNPDRRPENPNCLYQGNTWAIFDHDLAFTGSLVIGWHPPWQIGALDWLIRPGGHVLAGLLRGKSVDFARLRGAWDAITDQRLGQYRAALPPEWRDADPFVGRTLSYLATLRDNAQSVLDEVMRVLR